MGLGWRMRRAASCVAFSYVTSKLNSGLKSSWDSLCVDDEVQGRSYVENVPFRGILEIPSGLPVQLYRDVTASDRDNDGSGATLTHGHHEKNWAKPRRNLELIF